MVLSTTIVVVYYKFTGTEASNTSSADDADLSSTLVWMFYNNYITMKNLVLVCLVAAVSPVAALDNGLGRLPPLGWSSWYS